MLRSGLGGIAATKKYVLFGDRDTEDFQDVWRCLDARNGAELWTVSTFAIGELDYGSSPRATPLIALQHRGERQVAGSERAFLLGAMGDLLCVDLATGKLRWQMNLADEFEADEERAWGYCSSPLLVDGKLIVNPGAPQASLAALDPDTGAILWRTPGAGIGHGSFIADELGGREQIVGHDKVSLGGWDPKTGRRLWTLKPPVAGDFNVPTPIVYRGQLLVATENNGVRLYRFNTQGEIVSKPEAVNKRLRPDMSTPVLAGDRLFCVDQLLYQLDLTGGLKDIARLRDPALGDYAASFTDGERVLIIGNGNLLLFDAKEGNVISRTKIPATEVEIYSRPALVDDQLYLRSEDALLRLSLQAE